MQTYPNNKHREIVYSSRETCMFCSSSLLARPHQLCPLKSSCCMSPSASCCLKCCSPCVFADLGGQGDRLGLASGMCKARAFCIRSVSHPPATSTAFDRSNLWEYTEKSSKWLGFCTCHAAKAIMHIAKLALIVASVRCPATSKAMESSGFSIRRFFDWRPSLRQIRGSLPPIKKKRQTLIVHSPLHEPSLSGKRPGDRRSDGGKWYRPIIAAFGDESFIRLL
jgi:hypothetical protein